VRFPKTRNAKPRQLAWDRQALAGPETLRLHSPGVLPEQAIPLPYAARRVGGQNISPALAWTGIPAGAAQLLLVIEDPDAPTSTPWVHCVALLDPGLAALPAGSLNEENAPPGVRVLHGTRGRGYQGPEGMRGHGPHRYAFQLFALPRPLPPAPGGRALDRAKPQAVFDAAAGPVLARGRFDAFFTR
jgi:Raf kinase inhibitor-like YbhB/YbcL family protein